MEALVLGIAGLVATTVSSALGLHFTARARTAPIRELLYSEQLDLADEILRLLGRARVFAALLVPGGDYEQRARTDLGRVVTELAILCDRSAALFPTELFAAFKTYTDALGLYIEDYDHGRVAPGADEQLKGHQAKVGLLARATLGIDELSQESLRLFTSGDVLARLAEVSPNDLATVGREGSDDAG